MQASWRFLRQTKRFPVICRLLAPRYSLSLDTLSKIPGSRALVNDLILTLLHKPHCLELLSPQIPLSLRRLHSIPPRCHHPPALFLLCPVSVVTHRKHHEFSKSSSLYTYFPTEWRTRNGPKNFASNFRLCLVLIYLLFNQTFLLGA